MFFEGSRAYVFLTADEDRALPRGQATTFSTTSGPDCCDDLGIETKDCSGMICFCEDVDCLPGGRPFVVEDVARVAAVGARDGWA
jgi:hypothetical protein